MSQPRERSAISVVLNMETFAGNPKLFTLTLSFPLAAEYGLSDFNVLHTSIPKNFIKVTYVRFVCKTNLQ
jgi:hypothetical protein